MTNSKHITILGGGPAGLAVGYFARKNNIPFTIYEASEFTGGNSVTFKHDSFYYDSGAHRFHDKIPEITNEVKLILGDNLFEVNAPSKIFLEGKFVDFPLSPLNLIKHLGLFRCSKAFAEILYQQINKSDSNNSFENAAINRYGKTIANLFLLNYSNKLWGLECSKLSRKISGNRLKGLNVSTFIREAFGGDKTKTAHLDGIFFYPKFGIGQIMKELENACGTENIKTRSAVTKIFTNEKCITQIEINKSYNVDSTTIINTLPLNLFVKLLEPAPINKVIDYANALKFRNIILIAFFINKKTITPNASIYFPNADIPFTRIYEPKNRSTCMSPADKTSLVIEIPCFEDDSIWNQSTQELINKTINYLIDLNFIKKSDIIDSCVHRIKNAYPVVELSTHTQLSYIFDYLKRFNNLKISGRGGQFEYNHIHDLLYNGKKIIEDYL